MGEEEVMVQVQVPGFSTSWRGVILNQLGVVGGAVVSTVLETQRAERTGWQGENHRNWCVNSTESH